MKSICYLIISLLIIGPIWAQNDNRGRARPDYNPDNLTDAQKRESETYIHEGYSQAEMLKGCAGLSDSEAELFQKDQAAAYEQFGDKLTEGMARCNGTEEVKGGGLSPEMAMAISKAYTMIIGMGGLGGTMKLPDLDKVAADRVAETNAALTESGVENVEDLTAQERTDAISGSDNQSVKDAGTAEQEATTEAEGEDERDDTDYCKYIAVGTETIAMLQQTLAQEEINNVPLEEEKNAQRAALMRVARGYKERSKNAQTQFMGWGATAGCYAVTMFTPVSAASASAWQNWLKLGASGFLTYVFGEQKAGFENAAEKTEQIANGLPGAGECNPHTDRDCYCSQTTTMGDPKYCAPYAHQRSIRDPGVTLRTSCITNKAEADPKCACLANDSCLHKGIDTLFSLDGLSGQVNPAFAQDLRNLSSGTVAGALNTDAVNRNLAAARNAMRKASDELGKLTPPNSKLTPAQIKQAEFLESKGVPKTLAQAMAAEKVKGDFSKTLALGGGSRSRPSASTASKDKSFNSSLIDRSSSGGLKTKRAKKAASNTANPFSKFLNKKGGSNNSSNGEILNFAQKAQASAQISNRKESSVFDIISRRYQVSAWRRLDLD